MFVAGFTGSGKSEILNYLFSSLRNQRLLVDTKSEFQIPGVQPCHDVEQIDWSAPLIHYRDAAGDLDEFDRLFYEAHHRRNLTVCCHELADLCADQPNRTPRWLRAFLRKGNILGNGLLGGSQRLVGMPSQARSESQHVIHMVPALDPPNHRLAAEMMQLHPNQLHQELRAAAALAETGKYSCLWFDREQGQLVAKPPLPDHLRRQIIVGRAINL